MVIREEYLTLMDGDHCAAAILNAFEMWSRNKANYIYKSIIEMQADLMGLFGRNRIGSAFKELRRRGFLLMRNNPTKPQDQTLQYLFQPTAILRAVFNRLKLSLKPHSLTVMLQALILKSQALGLKNESESHPESISEGKSEDNSKIISDERDFLPEGIDQAKFFQDDPSPNPEEVPQYLRQHTPSEAVRQQLAGYSAKLGMPRYSEVMGRCANAHSWEYVLKALANEPVPSPRSAPPPSSDDTTEKDIDIDATPDIDVEQWAKDQLASMREPGKPERELCAPTILPEAAKWWKTAYSQLEIQLDHGSVETFLRGVQLVNAEGNLWQFTTVNQYAADMLQHRLYREIRRVLADVIGVDHKQLDLRFAVEAVQHG